LDFELNYLKKTLYVIIHNKHFQMTEEKGLLLYYYII